MLKAQNPFLIVSFNIRKHVFIAPPFITLKARELDDATTTTHHAFRYCRVRFNAFQL